MKLTNVQNLFNTTWYANSFSTLFLQPGAPREATIGLRVKF
jgi:iron complex outermembrane receptor protein